jgi:hypothetical protein
MPEAFISALVRMGVCVLAYAALRLRRVDKAAGFGEEVIVVHGGFDSFFDGNIWNLGRLES